MFVGFNTVIKYSASFVESQFQIHTGSNKFCPDENLDSVTTIDPIKFPGRVLSLKKYVSENVWAHILQNSCQFVIKAVALYQF